MNRTEKFEVHINRTFKIWNWRKLVHDHYSVSASVKWSCSVKYFTNLVFFNLKKTWKKKQSTALLQAQQWHTDYVFHRCFRLEGHCRDNKTPQQAFIQPSNTHVFKDQFENKQPKRLKHCCVECSNRSPNKWWCIKGEAAECLLKLSGLLIRTCWGILQSSCSGLTQVSWAPRSVLMPQTFDSPLNKQGSVGEDEKGGNWSQGEGGGKKRCQICTKKEKSGLEIGFQTTKVDSQ